MPQQPLTGILHQVRKLLKTILANAIRVWHHRAVGVVLVRAGRAYPHRLVQAQQFLRTGIGLEKFGRQRN